MATRLYTHPACLEHDMGAGHPERPARLEAILTALQSPEFAALEWHEAPRASLDQIARAHPRGFVEALLEAVPRAGRVMLDGDTSLSPGSGEAALRAAGAVAAAVDAVAAGESANAFCAVRPPGHHAEPATAMGFCLFNNVAVGAHQARSAHGLQRIAVMDFDVHHGNGTQAMFERDPELFYASTHQMPLYPGTGSVGETGCGNICNAPLPPNAGSAEFRAAMSRRVLPALVAFAPGHAADFRRLRRPSGRSFGQSPAGGGGLCLGDGRASGSCGPALRRPGCIHAGRRLRLGRARRQRRRPCRTADGRLRRTT